MRVVAREGFHCTYKKENAMKKHGVGHFSIGGGVNFILQYFDRRVTFLCGSIFYLTPEREQTQ